MTVMVLKMIDVKSSSLAKIGYFRKTLVVEFINGNKYQFKNVPRLTYDHFMKADSLGSFFNINIKPHYKMAVIT